MSAQARPEETTEVTYADPRNERFPIHTRDHTLSAWHQVHRAQQVRDYRPDELEMIRHRIRRAARAHDLEVGD